MRINGTLKKWIDDRGFGFVVTPQNTDEIFVHISAFPNNGSRPIIGELISFEVQTDKNGKKRAIRVMREGTDNLKPNRNKKTSIENTRPAKGGLILVSVMILTYVANKTDILQHSSSFVPSNKTTTTSNAGQLKFKCDGRQHCRQMTSKAEAEYFIKHCPDTKMDGDRDGIPCENDFRY